MKQAKHKLIRDNEALILKREGKLPKVKILTPDDFKTCLYRLLKESVLKLEPDFDNSTLADILEIIYSFARLNNTSVYQLDKLREERVEIYGSYNKRLELLRVSNRNSR